MKMRKASTRLSPKFKTLGSITEENCRYETVLCQSKQRWSRRREGNPAEQEAEWCQGEYFKVTSDEELILENIEREIYNPETYIIDWRKAKTTNLRNHPRVYLPQARPTIEELELTTKEFMYCNVTKDYIHDS